MRQIRETLRLPLQAGLTYSEVASKALPFTLCGPRKQAGFGPPFAEIGLPRVAPTHRGCTESTCFHDLDHENSIRILQQGPFRPKTL
ncbi:hypothetical protein [Thiomonas sp. X19]|uniref:hypothetical protein n=1 Tax=Thiomonas sp. X19 TaxID=1050370 RepID=UPI001E42A163|nr:hypothetical protein [Thiomonas sp. X19]